MERRGRPMRLTAPFINLIRSKSSQSQVINHPRLSRAEWKHPIRGTPEQCDTGTV